MSLLIGELAERTGTSERLPRHYERAGLLRPGRLPNGYREYADSDIAALLRVRALLAAGLPTPIIRRVLPCTTDEVAVQPCPGVLDTLRDQLSALDRRAAQLDAARAVLRDTIAGAEARTDAAPASR
ncbi:MerR family transcriptional regulator [Streptomyces hokutonensis]|uniref:MerR family transcriptional regulator n=1 Tax=Streptomyces hokutonensis TaxID=1306990 RepID=A0ABW6LW32_9ACTN